jgi:hypothetical protein
MSNTFQFCGRTVVADVNKKEELISTLNNIIDQELTVVEKKLRAELMEALDAVITSFAKEEIK